MEMHLPPTHPFGNTGISVSAIGIGGWLGDLVDDDATDAQRDGAAVEAVRRGVELGVRYFDSSPAYGRGRGEAERVLGLGLQTLSTQERAEVTVSTKVGTDPERRHHYDADTVRWSLDLSLRRLQLDSVDIVYVHDPASDEHMDEIVGPGGAFEALGSLKADGVVRAVGLGVRTHRFLTRAIETGGIDAILPSYDYHLLRTSVLPVLELAAERGVAVANGSPYAAGLLAMDPEVAVHRRGATEEDLALARGLYRWSGERDVELGALAVQYSIRCPHIHTTLVGPRTAEEVDQNVRHATAVIDDEVWSELEGFRAQMGTPSAGGESQ
jgi:aryl-alcohol dehydrogenase-like predicted oxidoreductase